MSSLDPMLRKLLLLLLLAPLPALPVFASERLAALDEKVLGWMEEAGLPALHYGIIENGRVVHIGRLGEAAAPGASATADPAFAIGSLTKAFTAHAVLLLEERGVLALDQPVVDWLPEFASSSRADEPLRIIDLLHHRSPFNAADGFSGHPSLDARVEELARIRSSRQASGGFAYSNANYELLGAIIERAAKRPFDQFIQQEVLDPLGIKARFAPDSEQLGAPGHQDVFGWDWPIDRYRLSPSEWPSGGLVISLPDYLRSLQVHMDPEAFASANGLSPEGFRRWHAAGSAEDDLGYAFGWFQITLAGRPMLFHDGLTSGFQSAAFLAPDKGFAVVAFANRNALPVGGAPAASQIARNIGREWLGEPHLWDGFAGLATQRWIKLGLLGLFLLGAARLLRPAARQAQSRRRWVVSMLVGCTLASILLFGLPAFLGLPLRALFGFAPDLAALLLGGAAMAVAGPLLRRPAALAGRHEP
ncbi:serine hydrolase domain-containing protein [Pseudomarimonas salicorniae]|uniref:Beta-lactamase family protein n=1 Tax=Pseudomarimonas salicorniae TaxID=2933270 RepID=A0ABT0GCL7_9GAMM|nr:serine hydrolase domain-containing protein [Lysobacter sp. CAU 1642]MCK7592281.1 beta-lactamase family protein [Lysobacter sp. CAU 1642]